MTFAIFQHKNYAYFWWGNFISRIGTEMELVGLSWQIYEMTRSPMSLGIIGLCRFLPILFFSLISGSIADMFPRKNVVQLTSALLMLIAIGLTILHYLHLMNPLIIYIAIFINSTILTLETPSRQALIPSLFPKEHILHAMSWNTIMFQTGTTIGPMIGGFMISVGGVGLTYALNAISFIAVIFAYIMIKPSKSIISKTAGFHLSYIKEGLHYVFKTPLLYGTMLLDFCATFFSASTVLMPIFAMDILKVGPQGMGLLYASPAIGGVVAGLVVSSMRNIKRQGFILLIALTCYGICTIAFGLSKLFFLSLFFLFLVGATDIVNTIIRKTTQQLITPDEILGRMSSINLIFYAGGPMLGEFEAGFAAQFFGTSFSVILGGIGTIIFTLLIAWRIPEIRNCKNINHG